MGGTALITDESGTVTEVYDYYPYGAELIADQLGTTETAHTFTDKEFSEELGLYYFEARWYNPEIGQFSSRDPMDGVTYIYAAGNPLVYVDPTGLYVMETGEVEEGDTLSGITQELNDFYGTNSNYNDIALINGISDPNSLSVGQIVRMGSVDADGNIWTVPNDPDIVNTDYWKGLTSFQQKILHYSRNFYQGQLPATQADAEAAGWSNNGEAIAHNLNGASGNIDFRGPNGQQAIYDSAGNLVTSPENMGTYDYQTPDGFWNAINHKTLDVSPWLQWGNSPQDTTTQQQRDDSSILY